jgi:hypothetical protein
LDGFCAIVEVALIGLFATYTLIGGVAQIVLVCALAGFGIDRVWRMGNG